MLDREINKLIITLPKMPNPIFIFLFILAGSYGGLCLPSIIAPDNIGLFLFVGGVSIATGIALLVNRNKFYREKYKPIFDEINKRKQMLLHLIREKHYLK